MDHEIDSDILFLMGRYLDGTLTEEKSEKLLAALKADSGQCRILSRAVLVDLFLREITNQDQKTSDTYIDELYQHIPYGTLNGWHKEESKPAPVDKSSTTRTPAVQSTKPLNVSDDWFSDWDELIRIQNREKALSQMTPSELEEYRNQIAALRGHEVDRASEASVETRCENTLFATSTNNASVPRRQKKEHQPFWTLSNIAFAISLTLAVALIWGVVWESGRHSDVQQGEGEQTSHLFATIIDQVDPVWTEGTIPYVRGQRTGSGEVSLQSGMVKLIADSGAEIILEGPGRLSVLDPLNIWCSEGQLSITIPPRAQGFTVNTPFGKIVDRGTEFYINLSRNTMEVETAKGKVEIVNSANESSILPFGCGLFVSLTEKKNFQFIRSRFVPKHSFLTKLGEYVAKEVKRITSENEITDTDSNLLARFDFTSGFNDSVPNNAQFGKVIFPSLKLQNAAMVTGPLYGRKAVRFNDGGGIFQQKVITNDKYSVLTLSATVRIEKLGQTKKKLFRCGNFPDQKGSFSWGLGYNGESTLSLGNGITSPFNYFAPVLSKTLLGAWITLDVTMDTIQKKIFFYVNGKQVQVINWQDGTPIQLQNMVLGNVFEGDIAEFKIYKGQKQ